MTRDFQSEAGIHEIEIQEIEATHGIDMIHGTGWIHGTAWTPGTGWTQGEEWTLGIEWIHEEIHDTEGIQEVIPEADDIRIFYHYNKCMNV